MQKYKILQLAPSACSAFSDWSENVSIVAFEWNSYAIRYAALYTFDYLS